MLERTLRSLERLAAEKISVSACDLRELTRDRRVHLGAAVADAERGRADISPPSCAIQWDINSSAEHVRDSKLLRS